MKDGFLKVAAATPDIRVNAAKTNCKSIIGQIKEAASNGAKVLVLPEMCITGYTCGDLILQDSFSKRAAKALVEILNETKKLDILFAVGLPVLYKDKLYNAAAVCKDGKVLGFVTKSWLPNFGEFNENRYFATLDETVMVEFDGQDVPMGTKLMFCSNNMKNLRISCEICEDMWVPCPPSTTHALCGATVVLNLSANSETTGKRRARRMAVASNSARNMLAYVYADAGDGESTTDSVYAGNNMIYQLGNPLAEAKLFENGIIYANIDVDKISQQRRRRNTFKLQSDSEYTKVYFDFKMTDTELLDINPTPFVPNTKEALSDRCETVFAMQCAGLKKRISHIGLKTVTIGVSGGLDSTLALMVAAKTFDKLGIDRKGIIAVSMPCFGTTDRTHNNAKTLAEALRVSFREIPISKAVLQHFEDIGISPEVCDVTYENAQARERTQVLMDIANKTGGIVIGTGDLSELALGFATYNGDQMSMYGVNSAVPKTLMRSLVRYLAQNEDEKLKNVLIDIVETPVSPELLPPDETGATNQKTEEIIGSYEIHDFFIYHYLKFGFEKQKILRMAKTAFKDKYSTAEIEKCAEIFFRRFFGNQFKRSASPDGAMAGNISLSPRGGWCMPSDAVYEE